MKTVENTARYATAECHEAVRKAANIIASHGDYQNALEALSSRSASKPIKLALRFGLLCGLLHERRGESGADMYVRFSNWVLTRKTGTNHE